MSYPHYISPAGIPRDYPYAWGYTCDHFAGMLCGVVEVFPALRAAGRLIRGGIVHTDLIRFCVHPPAFQRAEAWISAQRRAA